MPPSPRTPTALSLRVSALAFLAVWAACLFIPAGSVPVHFGLDLAVEWSAVLAAASALWRWSLPRPGEPLLRLDLADLLALMGLGWVLLSAWNSPESFQAFSSFRLFLALGVWWYVLRRLWRDHPGAFPLFTRFWRLASLALAAWILAGLVWGRLEPYAGPFPNANFTACFLGLAILDRAVQWIHGGGLRSALPLLFLFLAWGGTRSRGAFLALAACLVLYLFTHYGVVESHLRRFKTRQWLVFAGLALFMLACSAFMIDRLLEGDKIDPRANLRPLVWAGAFHMACDHPFFGVGPGTFETVYPYYRSPDIWNTTTPFAHDQPLQAAAECGWPACALLLAFLGCLVWTAWRSARSHPPFRSLGEESRAVETAFLAVCYVFLQNLVDFTFYAWSILLPLAAWLTYALRRERVRGVELALGFTPGASRAAAGLMFLLAFWILGIGAWRDAGAQLGYYQARGLEAQGRLEQAQKGLERSLSLRPNLVEPWSLLGAIAMSRAVTEGDPSVKAAYFRLAQTDFDQAVSVSPRSVTAKENQVKLLEVRGRLDQALDLQEDLTDQLPDLPPNYLEQGEILLAQGHPAAALPLAQKAINLDAYYLEAYFLKAKALEALGRPSQAAQVYRDVEAKLRSAGLDDKIPLVENEVRRLQDGR